MIANLGPYPAMKDSGVESLGEVPKHWEVQPIGRMGRLFKGNGGSKEDEVPAGVPCVRYGDLYSRHEYFITCAKGFVSVERATDYTPIRYGDLLFAASGETIEDIGRSAVNLMQTGAVCGGDLLLMRPKVAVLPEYLGYAADSAASREQKARMGRGFTVVHIYRSQLRRLALPLPPVTEQAAIVRFLGHVNRRIQRYIRAKLKLIKLLEEQKQAIIHQAVTRGLDQNVHFESSGVDWLGEVPEHWEVRKVGAVSARVTKGTTPTTLGRGFVDEGVRFVKVESISQDRRVMATMCSFIDAATDELLARSRLRAGDVLVAIAGAIGRVAVVAEDDCPANCNQAVAIVSPHTGQVSAQWLSLVLSSPAAQAHLSTAAVQSAQANLSLADLRQMQVPIPPLQEQRELDRRLNDVVEAVNGAIRRASLEIELVKEFRTGLVAEVVTGKLDVREAAARLPDEGDEPDVVDEVGEGLDAVEASDDELDEVLEGAEV